MIFKEKEELISTKLKPVISRKLLTKLTKSLKESDNSREKLRISFTRSKENSRRKKEKDKRKKQNS